MALYPSVYPATRPGSPEAFHAPVATGEGLVTERAGSFLRVAAYPRLPCGAMPGCAGGDVRGSSTPRLENHWVTQLEHGGGSSDVVPNTRLFGLLVPCSPVGGPVFMACYRPCRGQSSWHAAVPGEALVAGTDAGDLL